MIKTMFLLTQTEYLGVYTSEREAKQVQSTLSKMHPDQEIQINKVDVFNDE